MPGSPYKGRIRVRVSGLLIRDEALLMIRMRSPVTGRTVWLPPGGGVKFGETAEEGLVREFREETGLQIEVGSLRHVNELVAPPFHALEFYFDVTGMGGEPSLGSDPEHSDSGQIMEELRFIPVEELESYSEPIAPDYIRTDFAAEQRAGKEGISYSPEHR
ncbi:NUDIX domain-containing protein [Halalkalibaculum sp. DA3122]|uniref:NUDIX domain-containing protein n=1 Tax=Halalkalibaculum sp. DA3122 TaxID=3373607 RepID=UPI003753EF3B